MRYVLLSLAILPVFCPTASAQTVDYQACAVGKAAATVVEVDISIGFHWPANSPFRTVTEGGGGGNESFACGHEGGRQRRRALLASRQTK